jgi:hypothetical protein
MNVVLCALLALAACGGPQEAAEESTTTAPMPATTEASGPDTTVAEPVSTSSTVAPGATSTTGVSADDDGTDSLLASLDGDAEITSGRIEGSIEMTGLDDSTSGVSEATILFSTSFDSTTGDSSFSMDMSSLMGGAEPDPEDPFAGMAAGFLGEMEMRQIGDTAYVKFPFFTAMFGAETDWVSMPADEGDEFTSDFEAVPTDPNEFIDQFDEAGASVEVVGTETVNGVDATHYRVLLDMDAMDLSAAEQAELAESGVLTAGEVPLDLWISSDGYMVRMVMEIDGTGMDVPPEEQFETMTMRYDFFDINATVVIEPPPASDVTPMEELEGAFGFDQ